MRKAIHILFLCGSLFLVLIFVTRSYGEDVSTAVIPRASIEVTSTLLFVGDIMLSRDVTRQINQHRDAVFPFRYIASTTRSADFTFGNLESSISNKGENQGSIYSFRANPSVIEGLLYAGFDTLSLANNHSFDWGREALADTVARLSNSGISVVGAGRNEEEANAPRIVNVKDAKIALIAFTNLYPKSFEAERIHAGVSKFNEAEIVQKIKTLHNSADIVVVSMHWGDEYELHANELQKKLGKEFIDAGADIVVGHHPHVVQELEKYKNGWIAYSLGNFIFDQNFSEETRIGAMLEVNIKNKQIENVRERMIRISDEYQPEEK